MQRHDLDAVHLVCGAIFVLFGVAFLSGKVDAYDFVSVWALPATLLAVGLVLAAIAVSRHRRDRESS